MVTQFLSFTIIQEPIFVYVMLWSFLRFLCYFGLICYHLLFLLPCFILSSFCSSFGIWMCFTNFFINSLKKKIEWKIILKR